AVQALMPSESFQLQASRDQVVTAFFTAQQLAMAQEDNVELITNGTNQIDVQVDGASITVAGVSYPILLQNNQSLTAATFSFNRLGQTSANSLTLSQGSSSVAISVSATGYIY